MNPGTTLFIIIGIIGLLLYTLKALRPINKEYFTSQVQPNEDVLSKYKNLSSIFDTPDLGYGELLNDKSLALLTHNEVKSNNIASPSIPSPSIPNPSISSTSMSSTSIPTPSIPTPSIPTPSIPIPSSPTPSIPTPSIPTPPTPSTPSTPSIPMPSSPSPSIPKPSSPTNIPQTISDEQGSRARRSYRTNRYRKYARTQANDGRFV